jgi:hypothetical protein
MMLLQRTEPFWPLTIVFSGLGVLPGTGLHARSGILPAVLAGLAFVLCTVMGVVLDSYARLEMRLACEQAPEQI